MDEVYTDKNFKVWIPEDRQELSRVPLESINADLGEVILNAFPEIKVNVRSLMCLSK